MTTPLTITDEAVRARLERTAEYLSALPRRRVHDGALRRAHDRRRLQDLRRRPPSTCWGTEPECGTSGCIAGHIPAHRPAVDQRHARCAPPRTTTSAGAISPTRLSQRRAQPATLSARSPSPALFSWLFHADWSDVDDSPRRRRPADPHRARRRRPRKLPRRRRVQPHRLGATAEVPRSVLTQPVLRAAHTPAASPYRIARPAAISFSGGRSSGYMLKHVVDAYSGKLPDDVVVVVFANTGREMPATLDFVDECAKRWDVPITWVEYDWDRTPQNAHRHLRDRIARRRAVRRPDLTQEVPPERDVALLHRVHEERSNRIDRAPPHEVAPLALRRRPARRRAKPRAAHPRPRLRRNRPAPTLSCPWTTRA